MSSCIQFLSRASAPPLLIAKLRTLLGLLQRGFHGARSGTPEEKLPRALCCFIFLVACRYIVMNSHILGRRFRGKELVATSVKEVDPCYFFIVGIYM